MGHRPRMCLGGLERIGDQPGRARAELVVPARNRVAAITGRDNGVDTTASSAFRPFTRE